MTTSCWNAAPTDRPTVDRVLDVLKAAAEQWKSRFSLPPQGDWSSTLSESEDEHVDTDHSLPLDSPRSPVIETPVAATPPLVPAPPSPVLPPSATMNEKSLGCSPGIPGEEKIEIGSISLPHHEPKPVPASAGKEKMSAAPNKPSRGEKLGIPSPIEQLSGTSEKEDTQQEPASLSDTKLGKPTPTASREAEVEGTVPVKPQPVAPKKGADPAMVSSEPPAFSDCNQTLPTNEPGLTEPKDERIAEVSGSFDSPQSSAAKPPLPTSSVPTPSLSFSPPLATKNTTPHSVREMSSEPTPSTFPVRGKGQSLWPTAQPGQRCSLNLP